MSFAEAVGRMTRAVQQTLDGVRLRYEPASGAPIDNVPGKFDRYTLPVAGSSLGAQSKALAVYIRLEDLPGIDPVTDTPRLLINGDYYRVHEPIPDEMGGIYLLLHKVPS